MLTVHDWQLSADAANAAEAALQPKTDAGVAPPVADTLALRVQARPRLGAAKCCTGRSAQAMAEGCIQLHGGMGLTWELPLSHLAKRPIMIKHCLGDDDERLPADGTLSRLHAWQPGAKSSLA